MSSILFLSSNAFVQILLSSLEAYPLESTGLLFGIRNIELGTFEYNIIQVIPHLNVEERKSDAVLESNSKKMRLIDAQKNLLGMMFIGGFHSHPKKNARLSKIDENYLKNEEQNQIEIVLGIEKLEDAFKEDVGWGIYQSGRILEAIIPIGIEFYQISLRAYQSRKKKIEQLEIRCAYLEILKNIQDVKNVKIHSFGEIYDFARSNGKDTSLVYNLLSELEKSVHLSSDEIRRITNKIHEYLKFN